MRIRKLGVVGAGTMGSGIAALAASAGIPVVLLDIPGSEEKGAKERSAPAAGGVQRALKARPAAFMDAARASLVQVGNTEDDLQLLADCDWVCEVIIEQPRPKQVLFGRLEAILAPHAVVTTNTSGIPMAVLTEGRSEAFRRRFLGTHFFNPPRYMHLLELIPTPDTDAAVLDGIREFSERVLGKGIVVAKDVPGFVANRLGLFGMVQTMRLMQEFGLTIDEVDALTGPLIGRPKSATFRTADISGLDVIAHVAAGLTRATGEDFSLPAWVQGMVEQKRLGEKTGAGFYRKQGKAIEALDWRTGDYQPQRKVEAPELARLGKLPLEKRFAAIRELEGSYGDFLRKLLLTTSHYVLARTPDLAYDIPSVDHALEWGYGWEMGPYKVMDALGLDWVRGGLARLGLDEPALLGKARERFYRDGTHLSFDGGYVPTEGVPGAIPLAPLARQPGRVLDESDAAALLDLGDGVTLLEFRSKMNTIGEGVLRMLDRALARVERDGLAGLVIGNDDPRTFSAGADLSQVAEVAMRGDWKLLDAAVRAFQNASMSLRRAPFPVVAAPFGLALGGGCELSLHSSMVQAHAELYMGLVEVGVGLLPAGGGTKELLFRFTEDLAPYPEADPFEAVKRAFQLIALAQTSTSALEARRMGLLRATDRITMNRDLLVADAKRRVLDLAPGFVPVPPRTIRVLGREAIGNLYYALFSFQEAGQATPHDVRIGRRIAYVLCGGDGPPRTVTEQDILDLEREAFLELLGTQETQQRIEHMLKTGKPLRN
ncbi:MAG TPA: 3-hydroxyacyl-CoA dehydrogenase/enoyl-CoA hydratase family protein [Gemmatimonadaceae bacterium]|nr:3-hydroxyacyl-CoA dehydrogenase/enoyl-CoA hydratase family protein [Gemmatimonadaceae bacterium]